MKFVLINTEPDRIDTLQHVVFIFDMLYTTGVHYWYNITESMNCDNFFPAFLLYNGGRLNAFGWAMVIEQSSKRFEHPPHSSFSVLSNTTHNKSFKKKCVQSFARPPPPQTYPHLIHPSTHIYIYNHTVLQGCQKTCT